MFPVLFRRPARMAALPLLALAAAAAGSRLAAPAAQVAGNTPGEFSVDNRGAGVYRIPIVVPPGTAGLQPDLALMYRSGAPDGVAGVGWSVYGLSMVARCRLSGAPGAGAVRYGFCLDDVQLVQVSPGVYRTEKESWTRVVARPGPPGDSLPASFVATTREGTVMEFGTAPDARVYGRGGGGVRVWALNRLADRNGNELRVTYDNRSRQTGEYVPVAVEYTGNARAVPALAPQRRVELRWEPRPDTVRQWRFGGEAVIARRLASIATSVEAIPVREYRVEYGTSPTTGRSRVSSVTEADGEGNTFPPLRLAWQEGRNALLPPLRLAEVAEADVGCTWGDFNGDGRQDLLCDRYAPPFDHWVRLSQGRSLGAAIPLGRHGSQDASYTWTDFNGDGLADLLIDGHADRTANAHDVLLSEGTRLGPRRSLRRFGTSTDAFTWTDFDGDGRADLAVDENAGQFRHWVLLSGGTALDAPITLGTLGQGTGRTAWTDLNGDGMSDPVFDQTAAPYLHWARLSTGRGAGPVLALGAFGAADTRFTWADFNGDGLADLLGDRSFATARGGHAVRISTGDRLLPEAALASFGAPGASFQWSDFNGDGLADLLAGPDASGAGGHSVLLSTGARLGTPLSLGALAGAAFAWPDVDGDGLPDLVSIPPEGRGAYEARFHEGVPPDLLTGVTNGLGGEVRVVYGNLTDARVYTRGSGAVYPFRDLQTPLPVVREHWTSDGRENPDSYHFDYSYAGAVTDLAGRGWLGFAEMTARDRQTGVRTLTGYLLPFPLTGLVERMRVQLPDGTVADDNGAAFEVRRPGDPAVAQVLKAREWRTHREPGSSRAYTVEKGYDWDAWGNPVRVRDLGDTATADDDVFTCTAFLNDTTAWVLGLPVEARATPAADAAGGCAGTTLRHTRTAYGPAPAFNVEAQAEWNDVGNDWLAVTYAYDAFGNVVRQENPATGAERIEPDPVYHTFPQRNTNALGQVTVRRHDPRFGEVVEEVSPNGNRSEREVDGFGREVAVRGPAPGGGLVEVARTERRYGDIAATARFYVRTGQRLDWDDGGPWAWREEWRDGLNRTWRTRVAGRGEAPLEQRWAFDDEARATAQTLPYYRGGPADPALTQVGYDAQGRVERMRTPDSVQTVSAYAVAEGAGQGTPEAARTEQTTAPGTADAGTITTWVNARGDTLRRRYAGPGAEVSRAYDRLQRVVRVDRPSGVATTYTYNTVGSPVRVDDTELGSTRLEYEPNGLLRRSIDAAGDTVEFSYDVLGRVVRRAARDQVVAFAYDSARGNAAITNPVGRLTRVHAVPRSAGGGGEYVQEFAYDDYGRVSATWITLGGSTYRTGYEYDPAGRLRRLTYPDGSAATTTWTPEGFVSRLAYAGDTLAWLDDHTALGQPRRVRYANGVESRFAFAGSGRVDSMAATLPSGQAPLRVAYGWDPAGRLRQVRDLADSARTQTFEHDAQGYLTGARAPGIYGTLAYEYDAAGNLVLKDGIRFTYTGQQVRTGVRGADTVFTAEYDAVGNRVGSDRGGARWTYQYDGESRLVAAARDGQMVYRFGYDEGGRRLWKEDVGAGATTFYVSGAYEVVRYAGGNERHTRYVDGPGGRVASITTDGASPPPQAVRGRMRPRGESGAGGRLGGLLAGAWMLGAAAMVGARRRRPAGRRMPGWIALTALLLMPALLAQVVLPPRAAAAPLPAAGIPSPGMQYFVQDQIGSTTLVTDGAGAQTSRVTYGPWGEVLALDGTDDFRAKFTGQELDEASGLYYYGARYYDPLVGRFLTPDVMVVGGPDESAAAYNRYAYAGNDPVLYTDPSGNVFGIDDIIFIVVVAVTVTAATYMGGAAVNHNLDPTRWDWTSPKTYGGLLAGAVIGAVSAVATAGLGAALGEVAGGIIGGALTGVFEGGAFAALGGGNPQQIAEQALLGGVMGAAFGGALAGAGRLASRGGRAGAEAASDEMGALARQVRSAPRPRVGAATAAESGCLCFAAGTAVHTPRGTVPVERVAPGDSVVAWDDSTGAVVVRPVVAVVQRTADTVVTVVAGRDTIRTTPEHPFRVGGAWVRAAALRPGDRLAALQGPPVAVSAVWVRAGRLTVHNFEVKGAHTYYVAAPGVLVHNQCFITRFFQQRAAQWSSRQVTRYRGTNNLLDGQDIMSGVLRSKAAREGIPPTRLNTSTFARVWHSFDSDWPQASQFVSVTSWQWVARSFARNGSVYAFEVPRGDLYRAWYSVHFLEAESVAKSGTRIFNPRIVPRRRGIPRHRPRRPAPRPLERPSGRGRGGGGAGRPRTTRGAR